MRLFSRFVSLPGLRDEFPVLERARLPERGHRRAAAAPRRDGGRAASSSASCATGRSTAHFERRSELSAELRAAYASVLGADPADVALTTCTTEGMAQVIGGLELGRGR